MNVLVLVGSLRAGSVNAQLASEALAVLPEGVSATVYDGLGDLPHYSEDLDSPEPGQAPASVQRFRAAVAAADALVVVTPEYNGSMPGVIKSAIDWASRPRGTAAIAGKPVAVLSASMSPRAGAWARENAVRVLTVAGAKPLEHTVGVGSAFQTFSEGRLVDEQVRAEVVDLMTQLLEAELVAA
ncbi:MAG: NADPH-dependent FMN reductase [Actinomycetales bacterium]